MYIFNFFKIKFRSCPKTNLMRFIQIQYWFQEKKGKRVEKKRFALLQADWFLSPFHCISEVPTKDHLWTSQIPFFLKKKKKSISYFLFLKFIPFQKFPVKLSIGWCVLHTRLFFWSIRTLAWLRVMKSIQFDC